MIGRRRRALGVLAIVAVLGGVAAFDASAGSAAVQPARQHVMLEKLCPKNDSNVLLVLENVTDDPTVSDDVNVASETLTVQVLGAGKVQTFDVVHGPSNVKSVVLAPGETVVVKVTGPTPVKWSKVYQAKFKAKYKQFNHRTLRSKQYCRCQGEPPPLPATTTTTGGRPGGGT